MKKCKFCGSNHNYKKEDGTPNESCQNCSLVEKELELCVNAINLFRPSVGKQRKLTIKSFTIERV